MSFLLDDIFGAYEDPDCTVVHVEEGNGLIGVYLSETLGMIISIHIAILGISITSCLNEFLIYFFL